MVSPGNRGSEQRRVVDLCWTSSQSRSSTRCKPDPLSSQRTTGAPHSSRPRVRGMMVEPSEVTDMDLHLMPHGQATTETEDPERPLTDAGRAAVQRVAKRARAADVRISSCLHSGSCVQSRLRSCLREIGVEPTVRLDRVLRPMTRWYRSRSGFERRPSTNRLRSSATCLSSAGLPRCWSS